MLCFYFLRTYTFNFAHWIRSHLTPSKGCCKRLSKIEHNNICLILALKFSNHKHACICILSSCGSEDVWRFILSRRILNSEMNGHVTLPLFLIFSCLNMRQPSVRWNASMAFECGFVKFGLWNEFVHIWLSFWVCGKFVEARIKCQKTWLRPRNLSFWSWM